MSIVPFGIMVIMALLGWFFLSPADEWPPYRPGVGQFMGSVAAMIVLILTARRMQPQTVASTPRQRCPLFLAEFGWGLWLIGVGLISDVARFAPLTLLWTGAVGGGLLVFAHGRLKAIGLAALVGTGTFVAGVWIFWILSAFVQELGSPNRPDDTSGMALVGLAAVILLAGYLLYLARRWRQIRSASPDS